MNSQTSTPPRARVGEILRTLALPVHRRGYGYLCIAIPRFALDSAQSVTKELYPYIAESCGCSDWRSVESAIRDVIQVAWERRNPGVWEEYFPNQVKCPGSKQFIATLAERIK